MPLLRSSSGSSRTLPQPATAKSMAEVSELSISEEVQLSTSPNRSNGDWERQQTPYRCQSRNHGLLACFSSCRRFAAERSLALRGLVSGTAKMRSNDSISAIVCSVSILLHHLVRTHNRSNESGISDVTARLVDRDGSRHAQTLERGASRSSTDVRHNDQFENPDVGKFNSIFFDLAYGMRGTKIPLLAHDFSK